MTDVILNVVPVHKSERLLKTLAESGYDEGPGPSPNAKVREGDVLEVSFRGNIKCCDEDHPTVLLTYNSHLNTSAGFDICEVDRFLQRNYSVFRGFVQVYRRVQVVHTPSKAEQEQGVTEPWIEISKELVSEHLVSIPKVSECRLTSNI